LDTAQYGTDEDGKDAGKSSLHAAVKEGNVDNVTSLLKRGADINARNESNRTPLEQAAMNGSVDIVL
jgi:ankyrin repeat protein